jgi:SNF2 family DNA or RNA helicase
LGLPTPKRTPVPLPMAPGQERLYRLLTDEFVRQADAGLDVMNRQALRNIGRSVMRLLQVVSNPALVVEQLSGAHASVLADVLADGDSPKLAYACDRARELAVHEKVLIWSTFRQNVEVIADRLRDVGAVFIHGGVGPGDEDDLERREGRIKAFKEQDDVRVLVANPATAAEGISLHNICQVAIYVDRTYNAAHYMQSEDRIVRLGLKPGVVPRMEILECVNSIDERVHERLRQKINAMSEALNDPSIRLDPTDAPIDPDVIENEDERTLGMTKSDANDLLASLKS